ncbi:hypothetical protein ElyMa_000201300 [Elysia marginata]|uniref:Uncharacterized protein n=1 Tax=Elysia marginata TaxID=1093978 RepID=A0AAV4EWC0_9GAST|nr:hypothetical protein ElyMa_000201300 [Elysia marginata]
MIQEVDSAHSSIERHLRNVEVYSPISLIRQLLAVRRSPKFRIIQMRLSDFLSFDEARVMNFSKVPFTAVKQLVYEQGKTNFVSFGRSHSVAELSCVLIIKDRRTPRGKERTPLKVEEVKPLQILKPLNKTFQLAKEKIADLRAMFVYMPKVDVDCFEAILKSSQ